MNLPVYEEERRKEKRRERKTRKVCESNAQSPNRARNKARSRQKKNDRETPKRRFHARSSQTACCLRPLSFCLSRFPCRTNTLRASSTANNFVVCILTFFFFEMKKTSVTTERSTLLVTLVRLVELARAANNSRPKSSVVKRKHYILVKTNVPREILQPLRVRERPHFRTQSVLVRVPLRRVQTDACESRGRFCDGDLRVEDVREAVVR